MARCLAAFEEQARHGQVPDLRSFAVAALASALELMALHDFVPGWAHHHTTLTEWLALQRLRPSMQQTAPGL